MGQESEERLARLALDRGFITPAQLKLALDTRDREGITLAEALLGEHILTNAQVLRLCADAQGPETYPPLGRFTLIRELGRGSSAVVFEALDTADAQHVALKVFHPGPAADVERFIREGVVASKIPAHPGLVGVKEAGDVEGRRYLVMDLVPGLHMDQWIRRGSVTFPAYIEVLRDAALAVDHAHRYGVIHRDLKPENILIDASGRARVTDFGLAKTVDARLTQTGIAVGTPAYMSPEQILGRSDVDRRTDIWALGVMLYEGLTGERPFGGATAFEAMKKAVEEAPPPPSKFSRLQMNPLLFGTIERVAMKALSKEPRDRHASARAFADDLSRWLKGETFEVKVIDPPKPKKKRTWIPIAAAALLGAAGATAYFLKPKDAPLEAARPAMSAVATRRGAILEYYGGIHFNTLGKRELDERPRFGGLEAWPGGPEYYVSQRWSGRLIAPKSGAYVFTLKANEGARLLVSGVELVSNLGPSGPTDRTSRVVLQAGPHEILIECVHSGTPEELILAWGPEGGPAAPLRPSDLSHVPGFIPVAPPALNGPVVIPGAQEGEALELVDSSGKPTAVNKFEPFRHFWRGRWSGRAHLWWGSGVRKGDVLTVRFRASAGRRTLALGVTQAMDHGVFAVLVNGAPTSAALDLFSADLSTREVELKDVELRDGLNELSFRAVDVNPSAREWAPGGGLYKLGLDYVIVK